MQDQQDNVHHYCNGKKKYYAEHVSYPSSIVTYSMMTELLIFTLDPILQCLPITDFLIETFSDMLTHSPTIQSEPT